MRNWQQCLVGFLLGLGLSFHAPKPVAGQDSVTAVAGDYSAGWLKRLIFGADYRDLWVTPIRTEVLDLSKFAGGLTPARTGGYGKRSLCISMVPIQNDTCFGPSTRICLADCRRGSWGLSSRTSSRIKPTRTTRLRRW